MTTTPENYEVKVSYIVRSQLGKLSDAILELERESEELKIINATLIVNFGDEGKCIPNILTFNHPINVTNKVLRNMVHVLEYYHNKVDTLEKQLSYYENMQTDDIIKSRIAELAVSK